MPLPGKALGQTFTRAIEQAPLWLRPILVAALAMAMLMLGLATLPQSVIPGMRLTAIVARRRLELALLGICAVAAVATAAALT